MSVDLDGLTAVDDSIDLSKADRGDSVPDTPPTTDEPAKEEDLDSKPEAKGDELDTEPEAAKPETKPAEDSGKFIPKQRYDEQVQREREQREAAERRAQQLEEQLQTQTTSQDLEAAKEKLREFIKQRNSFLADGELEKAAEIDEKIFDFQQRMADYQAEQKAMSAKELAKEEMRYDAVVAKLEVDFPQINPDHELYDASTVENIRAAMLGFQQSMNMRPSQALSRAVKLVLGDPAKPKEDTKDDSEAVALRRKQEAVERNAKIAGKQPASTADVGIDHDKVGGGLTAANVMQMSYEEFSKLPETALAKMRGDLME